MAPMIRRAASALALLTSVLLVFTTVATDLPPQARNGRLWAMIQAETQGLFTVPSPDLWFTQRIDHFSKGDATYQQRFYEVDTFWKGPDGPVILYIGGEASMDKAPTGFVETLAQKFGAKILALEHRFYGKSIPNNDLSTANYKYLTVQQALADLDHFKHQYEAHNLPTHKKNKWIAVGGSYPGALSAWFRVAYPNTTVAALSSSGVVLPVYKFHGFDEQVAQSAGKECADAIRLSTKAFEKEIASGNGTLVKRLLGAEALDDGDFFYMLADAAAMAVQYGKKEIVCAAMVNAAKQQHKIPLTEAFAAFTIDMYGNEFGSGCFYDTKCLTNEPSRWADVRSWRWQKCAQLAYFQVAPTHNQSLRSSIVDLEYHVKQCKKVFGLDASVTKKGVDEITKLYGGAEPKAHNIFFANGGDDPWQRASVLKSLSDDEVAFLAECDSCGHCGDLHAVTPNAPEQLKKQQEAILLYLTKWLGEQEQEEEPGIITDPATENARVETEEGEGEMYRSSPFVLVPIVVAFVVLLVVVHSDLIRDSPTGRRGGYVRLEAA